MTDSSNGHTWEIILALGGALQAMTVGVIHYLVKQVSKRDDQLEKSTNALVESSKTNAEIAGLVPELLQKVHDADMRDAARSGQGRRT